MQHQMNVSISNLWRKMFPPSDKFDAIFDAIDSSMKPDDVAKDIGVEWNLVDIHEWNKRFKQCEDCGRWNRRNQWCQCQPAG